MDTPVVLEVVAPGHSEATLRERTERAFAWFAEVERLCSRFDETSELRSLCRRVGEPTSVSALLFSALDIALHVARITDGAFDPTIGHVMEQSGFNRNYLTGERVAPLVSAGSSGEYRDVLLDRGSRAVTLLRPMALDLGAVAKGLAIDLAAQEFSSCRGFAINAGGDIRVGGLNADGGPWRIGIRHPRRPPELLTTLCVRDGAVCTSGDYERPAADADGHHIRNPRSGRSASAALSATVIAPTAVVADALSTAAFVVGLDAAIELLNREGADGLIVGPNFNVGSTPGMKRYRI